MKMTANFQESDATLEFSKMLRVAKKKSEPVFVDLEAKVFCPNRIVPVLAMADEYRHDGGQIVFNARSDLADSALVGFRSGDMRPPETIDRPFGRVWRFDNADELDRIVTAVELELNKTALLAKGVKICFTWCLNEVMDNVLNHSANDGNVPGYVMVQYLPDSRLLKVCVFDAGMGLKASFTGSKYSPKTDEEAIDLAVKQNVTSGNGQGNGLWGLRCLVGQSPKGTLHIRSGNGEYLYDPRRSIESVRRSAPVSVDAGTTMVDFQIVCDGELSFEKVFPGAQGQVDLWIENRETESGAVRIKVLDIVKGCGSREKGKEVRTVVENLIEADRRKVIIDFENAETCSSAFVDELVGKLLEKYGFSNFVQTISIANIHGIVALLLNHSVRQRLALERVDAVAELGIMGEPNSGDGDIENSRNLQDLPNGKSLPGVSPTSGSQSQVKGTSAEALT